MSETVAAAAAALRATGTLENIRLAERLERQWRGLTTGVLTNDQG